MERDFGFWLLFVDEMQSSSFGMGGVSKKIIISISSLMLCLDEEFVKYTELHK